MLKTLINLCSQRVNKEMLGGMRADQIENLAEEAARQGVAGWLLKRLRSDYEDVENVEELKRVIQRYVFATYLRNKRNKEIIDDIRKILGEAGIEVVLLKGAALMLNYYPDMAMREIGDIDIWVRHEDAYRAHELLLKAGGEKIKSHRTKVLYESVRTHLGELNYRGQIIEIHYNLYSPDSDKNPTERVEDHIDSSCEYAMVDEPMMLYHLTTHIIKNKNNEGSRLGWMTDLIVAFERWGERKVEIMEKAKAMNPHMVGEMEEIWRRLDELTPEDLEGRNIGLKNGIKTRLKSFVCLSSAVAESVKKEPTIAHLRDIMYDLRHRQD